MTTPAQITKPPQHVAVIMDGNGRWATSRGLPRVEGHRAGALTVRMIVEESRRLGIRYLTLFAFSTENWERPKAEVDALMKLFQTYLKSELPRLLTNDVRLRAIGELNRLPQGVRELLAENEERTSELTGMDLILAISYGGREEILSATKKIAEQAKQGTLNPEQITAETLRANLYAPGVPDPDLLIRTSDEQRISNFLLWQLAYSEIVVSPVHWPDFSKEQYHACLSEYQSRERRFGLVLNGTHQESTLASRT